VEKRRWRARTPRPVGTSDARCEPEASWNAERQRRFGRQSGAFDQFEEFCLMPQYGRPRGLELPHAGVSRNLERPEARPDHAISHKTQRECSAASRNQRI